MARWTVTIAVLLMVLLRAARAVVGRSTDTVVKRFQPDRSIAWEDGEPPRRNRSHG